MWWSRVLQFLVDCKGTLSITLSTILYSNELVRSSFPKSESGPNNNGHYVTFLQFERLNRQAYTKMDETTDRADIEVKEYEEIVWNFSQYSDRVEEEEEEEEEDFA